jgi:hypothetical protein
MTPDIIERMKDALHKCVAQFENLEDRFLADAGCIECTVGTVPNNRNTGLCGYHEARAVLTEAERLGEPVFYPAAPATDEWPGRGAYLVIPVLDKATARYRCDLHGHTFEYNGTCVFCGKPKEPT